MEDEVTMICMDTSILRQKIVGYYKLTSQNGAISHYFKEKTKLNPKSYVGIVTMGGAGGRCRMLVKPTRDYLKIINLCAILRQGISDAKRTTNIVDALRIAKSGLVHPEIENKKVHKRIVVFAGGPIYDLVDHLKTFGTELKHSGVAVDAINFGNKFGNQTQLLEVLVAEVNNNDNSHIIHVSNRRIDPHLCRSVIFPGAVPHIGEGGSGLEAAGAAGKKRKREFHMGKNQDA